MYPKRTRYWMTLGVKYSTLIWTYQISNELLKVIVMGNGYGIVGAFLLRALSLLEEAAKSRQTNLRDIVQNPDERIAVLEARRHAPSQIISEIPRTLGTFGTRVTCISSSL